MSASKIIETFLETDRLPTIQELRGILRDLGRANTSSEFDLLDLKRDFDNSPKAWLDLLRHVVAMANSGGGVLIFGIENDGTRAGLSRSLISEFDATKIANQLNRHASGARVRTTYTEFEYYNKLFGALFVHTSSRLVVFDKTIQYPGTNKTALRQGVLYVRRKSATEPATQSEINNAIDRVVARNLRAFIARIDHVAALPPSAQLIATAAETDKGYILTASGEGVPVTIVGPEQGATAVRIDETLLPDVPLSSPVHELANQVRHWHADPTHRVKPSTLNRWYLSRDLLDMSVVSDGAEFAFLSAIDGMGFPTFWASHVPRERLREILMHKIESREYPAIAIVPYMVGSFFWNERSGMLPADYGLGETSRRIIDCPDKLTFRTDIRRAYGRFQTPFGVSRIRDAIASRELAQQVFNFFISRDEKIIQANRQVINQLDLFLHAPSGDD